MDSLLLDSSDDDDDDDADEFTLEAYFWLDLKKLADNEASYTIQQLITALETTTILRTLVVDGDPAGRELPPFSQQRVVEPLCQCLANLRLQNEHHFLEAVQFSHVNVDIIRQFLVALKPFGISEVKFHSVEPFPVHCLLDFCHDNSNLKVLQLLFLTITDGGAAVSFPPNDRPRDPSGDSANLDNVILNHVKFKTPLAATNLANFVAQLSVSALELGTLIDDCDEFTMPSVELLTLYSGCGTEHFQAALDAGMATVTRLNILFERYREENETTKKLESLTRMIRGAVKLNRLIVCNLGSLNPLSPPRQFFQAFEACPTVTEIYVNSDVDRHDFTEPEERQLRQVAARNSELEQFVANPSTFPNDNLLYLISQFDNCPSGLYMLTRRLPEAFSFAKGNTLFP